MACSLHVDAPWVHNTEYCVALIREYKAEDSFDTKIEAVNVVSLLVNADILCLMALS